MYLSVVILYFYMSTIYLSTYLRIDGYETDPTGGDWFCYHSSSPFIFPPSFCTRNNIKLKVSLYLSIYLSVCLFVCLSVCLSMNLAPLPSSSLPASVPETTSSLRLVSIFLSIYLSISSAFLFPSFYSAFLFPSFYCLPIFELGSAPFQQHQAQVQTLIYLSLSIDLFIIISINLSSIMSTLLSSLAHVGIPGGWLKLFKSILLNSCIMYINVSTTYKRYCWCSVWFILSLTMHIS